MNWGTIFGWVVSIATAIPNLITTVEGLWKGQPKSGPQKWLAVEQALSGSIQAIASEVVAAVPNATADAVATKVDVWCKSVNDLTVQLFNDLGLMPASTAPPPAAGQSPLPAIKPAA